jgi:hypothetical protein
MSKGKSIADDIISGLESVTKTWAKQRKAEERHANAQAYRNTRLFRVRRYTIQDAAYEYMPTAYLKASANGTLPANARQIMYVARPYIQQKTGQQLGDKYFTQVLLPGYMEEHDVDDWDVVFDDRGSFPRAPHQAHHWSWNAECAQLPQSRSRLPIN